MSPWLILAAAAAGCALVPAAVYLVNLTVYRPPREGERFGVPRPPVSVLIPARDEEGSIGTAVRSALASRGVELEVVVLDDGSTDRTAGIVRALAAEDDRVRLAAAPPLPAGWCGKQHACARLARLARHDVLVFVDADVRLAPDGLARAVDFLESSGAALVSGFPRQVTGTLLERMLLPLIHFVLLGFLPMWRMRGNRNPAYGAGCGQLFVARRGEYEAAGGHAAIRASLHDGVKLPRAFRRAGFRTDLFDATEVAACRMYTSGREVWNGLAKNATEGLAAPAAIVPWTVLLGAGQVLPPFLLLVLAAGRGLGWWPAVPGEALALAALATVAAYLPRLDAARRFRQSLLGAALHPLGVALLLAVQWHALARRLAGRPAAWKGRSYDPGSPPPPPGESGEAPSPHPLTDG